ncbi:MAG: Tim44/TimA family putative adaptor protein [Alphaproteobacteria bacterium]
MNFLDVIIFGGIAVFIFLRLRSVLGQRRGHEQDEPFNVMRRKRDEAEGASPDGGDNVVPLPNMGPNANPNARVRHRIPADEQIDRNTNAGSAEREGLKAILAADPSFELEPFFDGAKSAYEMILVAFAQGAKDDLRPLLAADVMAGFEAAIDARADAGETQDVTIIGIRETKVEKAELTGSVAAITLRFVAEMISCTRNEDGAVVDGHPNEVVEVIESWTFERDTGSDDPNWTLVSTAG